MWLGREGQQVPLQDMDRACSNAPVLIYIPKALGSLGVHLLNSIPTQQPPADSPPLVFFIAFLGGFQRWDFKNTTENALRLQSKSCRRSFIKYKRIDKNPKPLFFGFVLSRLWARHAVGRFW
jgi:hypothetical protein